MTVPTGDGVEVGVKYDGEWTTYDTSSVCVCGLDVTAADGAFELTPDRGSLSVSVDDGHVAVEVVDAD